MLSAEASPRSGVRHVPTHGTKVSRDHRGFNVGSIVILLSPTAVSDKQLVKAEHPLVFVLPCNSNAYNESLGKRMFMPIIPERMSRPSELVLSADHGERARGAAYLRPVRHYPYPLCSLAIVRRHVYDIFPPRHLEACMV